MRLLSMLACASALGLAAPTFAATAAAPAPTVSPAEAARQLMDYAEQTYPTLFPGPATTKSFAPLVYRYYPATANYLGVALAGEQGYTNTGVYAMGGSFAPGVVDVGPLTRFITPQPVRQTLDLPNNALVADMARGVYYASVPASVVGKGNRIATIDATSGSITLSAPVGSEPGALAIASDGKSLYVALDGSGELLRLSLPAMQEIGRLRLPNSQAATGLAASPLEPGTVAVSVNGDGLLVRNMVAQAKRARVGQVIVFGADGTQLFGLNTEDSGFELFRAPVLADGLANPTTTFADTGYYWHTIDRVGSSVVAKNRLWSGTDLARQGTVGVTAECLARSSTRLICAQLGYTYPNPPSLVTVDVSSVSMLEQLTLPSEATDGRPVLGPGASMAVRTGIDHPAHRTALRILLLRDEMLR